MPKKFPRLFILSVSLLVFQNCYFNDGSGGGGDPSTEEVSFETDVIKIFDGNCITSGCHTGASPAGNLNLDVSGSDVNTVYTAVEAQISVSDPASSVLLKKATNETTHNGGLIFAESSDEYAAILKWITDGAANN